ncbi:MAG: ribosome maturation factor RimM [Spirochaetota bacterium]
MKDELTIGRVRTAHGVKGEIKVESFSGETEHFLSLERVTLVRGSDRRDVRIESARAAHKTVLIKLEGVDTPEEAKRWRGWDVVVDRSSAASLGEDEYYFADLIGLRVFFDDEEVGRVANVWEGGRTALLGIVVSDGSERLVPFQAEFVASVDLDGGRLVLTTAEVIE